MRRPSDRLLSRIASAARPGPPLLRITVSPRWARLLIAAGARRSPLPGHMTAPVSDTDDAVHDARRGEPPDWRGMPLSHRPSPAMPGSALDGGKKISDADRDEPLRARHQWLDWIAPIAAAAAVLAVIAATFAVERSVGAGEPITRPSLSTPSPPLSTPSSSPSSPSPSPSFPSPSPSFSAPSPTGAASAVCQSDGTGCTKAGTYPDPSALISSNYGGFKVTWSSTWVQPYSSGVPLVWTVAMTYKNVDSSAHTLSCSGHWMQASYVQETMSGGRGNDGTVSASATTCSENPGWTATVAPGSTVKMYATFNNVPWRGSLVVIEWGDAGTSASLNPFT